MAKFYEYDPHGGVKEIEEVQLSILTTSSAVSVGMEVIAPDDSMFYVQEILGDFALAPWGDYYLIEDLELVD